MAIGVVAGVVLAAILTLIGLFKLMWRVAEPNEALVISGSAHKTEGIGEGMGFRIVTGRGTLVLPGVQAVRKLSLDLNETQLNVDCVTHQGIPLRVKGVVIFKIGDDFVSIANAARRFLDQQKMMPERVHIVFMRPSSLHRGRVDGRGHDPGPGEADRADPGGLRYRDGEAGPDRRLAPDPRDRGPDGLHQEPGDAARGRRAAGRADRAGRGEPAGDRGRAGRVRPDVGGHPRQRDPPGRPPGRADKAAATARQAGPLSEAAARQEVVVQETRVAELEAHRREQQLQADVRKPADAAAYETRTRAEAERDARISAAQAKAKETELAAAAEATRVTTAATADAAATEARGLAAAKATRATGEAEAAATQAKGLAVAASAKAKGLAEADAIKARAAALAENQEAVVAQQLAENWPAIVEAGAGAFGNVEHMVLLNGAEGMSEMFAKALTMGGTGLGVARQLLASMSQQTSDPAGSTGSAGPGGSAGSAGSTLNGRIPIREE